MASTLSDAYGVDRVTSKGHGTEALGPSDSTDSGSDITGAPGVVEGDVIGLARGTNEDLESRSRTAGRDLQVPANNDILPDHVEVIPELTLDDSKALAR